MATTALARKKNPKHRITWDEFSAFAATTKRDVSHVFRVFKGERSSAKLTELFRAHFGFAMSDTALAGRRRRAA